MSCALIVIKKPDISVPAKAKAWTDMKGILSTHKEMTKDHTNPESPKILTEGVFQIDLTSDLNIFVEIASFAQAHGLPYKVLFLHHQKPEWVRVEADQRETPSGSEW